MADERILSIVHQAVERGPSGWTPAGEHIAESWPVPFGILDGSTVEIRINTIAWCAGPSLPAETKIRFRLGGTAEIAPSNHIGVPERAVPLFVDEATHGVLIAEFDVASTFTAGSLYYGPAPEFGMDNAARFGGIYTAAMPTGTEYFRVSSYCNSADAGCGLVAMRVDFRGLP